MKSFPEATASPAHPSSRSFDLSASVGVTDAATPSGSLLAWCQVMADSFTATQKRFSQRIQEGRACHSLLPALHRFERVSNSPTQGRELKANPDILDLLRNKVPDFRQLPISIKEGVSIERSLRSMMETHSFLTWSVMGLLKSLHEKKLLPKDDPVISQLQKSFSKACSSMASGLASNTAFMTMKRRQLLLSHVVPSVSEAQKRSLLSDPFFQTGSLFDASSVESARSAARDLSLFKPHLKASSSSSQSRRQRPSSSSAQRGSARQSSRPSSSQRSSSPFRQQSGRKGDARFHKKSSGTPPETRGFSEIGVLSPHGGRRLPSQLLVGLEGSGGGRLGSRGTAGWLSDPLRPSTSSIRASALPAGVLPSIHQGSRLNPGASKPSSEGGSRASPTVSGFLQPSLPRPEGFGVVAPHHRSVDPERLHHLGTLPHGDSSVSPEFHPPRRLDDLPEPARCLSSGSSASRFASFPSLRGSRKDLPVQGPLFRSYNRASSLHEDYGTGVCHPPQARGQDASLPGRLAHPGLYGNRLSSVKGQAPISLQRTRHPGQLQEVVSSAHSVSSVLRHGDSISAFYRSSHTSTSQQSHSPYRGVLVNPVSSGVPLASPSRPRVFSDSSRLWRHDQDEASSALPQGPVGLPGRSVPGLLVPSLSRGPSLVVESGSAERGSESLYSSSGHQLLLGRFGCRLGNPRRRTPCLGPLAPPSEDSLYQHERTSSSSARPAGLRTPAYGNVGSSVLRQHHHSSLPSSFGRDVLFHSERYSTGDSPLSGESPHSSSAPVHHGIIQCHRGRSESPQSGGRVRMDPSPGSSRSAGPQMASDDRSLCDLTDSKASSVLLSSLRSADSRDGCPSPILGRSPSLRLSSDRHHKESASQTEVLEELRVDSHSSVLASEGLVPRSSGTIIRRSRHTVRSKRSSKTAPLPPVPPKSAYASADCMATIKRFAIQAGFSPALAGQLIFSRRLSTRLNYQARWGTYRKWCKDFCHRSSSPSIAKIADFLTYMFKSKGAALSTIKGYRAMLAAVFKFPLPEISTSPILKDLIRSFEISAPRPIFPPPWELDKVLQFLSGPPFEPLARASFLDKTKKALFLLAMATAKRISELQALSFSVSFQGEDLVLYYDPFFRAKTESVANPLPRSIIVPSLSDFAGDLPERVHCPVRAIKYLRKAARSTSFIPSRLFVSPRNPERAMSKNAMSFYLRQLIVDSGAVSSARPPRAHDIRGISTSLNYYSNLSLSNLMQVATWRSNRVFASRYLKEVSATQDNIQQFGPLVIAGDRLKPKNPQRKHRL